MIVAKKELPVMKRLSFLGNETEELVSYRWPITGIGVCQIGFGICKNSGLLLQTTTVPHEIMLKYYKETATYINPNHDGNPTPEKVNDLTRLLHTVRFVTSKSPASVLQLGSSDGYTLSRFREAGSSRVVGVEPGIPSCEFARRCYNVDCILGTAEDFVLNERFELIVLTHILEHLYDPIPVLQKLHSHIAPNGYLLIEVPLWERMDKQPIGVLSFEHLNYFCESTLLWTLYSAGYEAIHSAKSFNVNQYPVITIIAKRTDLQLPIKTAYNHNRATLLSYIQDERKFWQITEQKILSQVNYNVPSWIYGAGIHTSQLLGSTNLSDCLSLKAVIDSSPTKLGKKIGNLFVYDPELLDSIPTGSNVIVSSAASEKYIVKAINNRRSDLNVVKIYGDVK